MKNSAAHFIRSISVPADNYVLAWTTLAKRCNRPRLLATSLVDAILNAPESNQESFQDLNKFVKIFDESVALLNYLEISDLGVFVLFFYCVSVLTADESEAV